MRSIGKITILFICAALVCSAGTQAAERADLVRVVKSKSRLYLEKDGEVFASFRATFGAQPKGHKQQEGDEKTPEGRYFLTYKNSNSAFYRSIAVSYPNDEDREKARKLGVDPGGDIMVHGQANGWEWIAPVSQFVNWTDGCIGLSNKDMDIVWGAVEPGIPIVIEP
jgi:murein L,D-transpeptidase YafK